MDDSERKLLKAVKHYQECLERYIGIGNEGKMLHCLEKLYKLPVKVAHLEETGVGRSVNGLRKNGGKVGESAKALVIKWKDMVLEEQEEVDEEEEDEDEREDGYESADSFTREDDARSRHEVKEQASHERLKSATTSHDHRKQESNKRRTEENSDEEVYQKRRKNDSDEEAEEVEVSRKHKHKRRSDHEDDKRKHKSKHSSDDGAKEKRHKSSKKLQETSSEEEEEEREPSPKPHKSDRSKEKHRSSSSGDSKRDRGRTEVKDKREPKKEARESQSKAKEQPGEEREKRKSGGSKSREGRSKRKEEGAKQAGEKREKPKNGPILISGIDSGSGASFAEALGMCEPSSSKGGDGKRAKKEKPNAERREKVKIEETISKISKEPSLDLSDLNLSSLLPAITPNYRPIGNLLQLDSQPKKLLTEYEQLSSIISSKTQRTKVYSGNKTGNGKVSSLFEICIRILQDNIDALEYTGGVPYIVLKPILEKATPVQLFAMEHHNPYLIEDTDELWQVHCQKHFRARARDELDTWRETFMRCQDERDAKLKALTANIKQAQDKSLPVRTTKLAYVDNVAKPPRGVARKQARNGTGGGAQPALTPSARLHALATAGEAGRVHVPNPGARAAERAAHQAPAKPKKAPLMLKSLSLLKNRFRR